MIGMYDCDSTYQKRESNLVRFLVFATNLTPFDAFYHLPFPDRRIGKGISLRVLIIKELAKNRIFFILLEKK